LKDVTEQFAEVEKRVTAVVRENAVLRRRVAELERELAQARAEASEFQNLQGKRIHIREKIERVLQSLEEIGEKGS
jgi:hypothetical protein